MAVQVRGLLSAWPRELGVWWHARGVATAWPHEESGDSTGTFL